MMKTRPQAVFALIGAMLLVLTMTVPQAGAQAGGSQQIISGQTVTWNGEWSPMPEISNADENVELLALGRGSSIVGFGGTAFPVGASDVRDVLLQGFATEQETRQVERGDYDNVSYSIDLSSGGANTVATFTLVIENPTSTTMALLISPPAEFAVTMTAAQAGITVDGAPIFQGVDAAQMQATIDAAYEAPPATPVATSDGATVATADAESAPTDASTGAATPGPDSPADTTLANTASVPSSGVDVRFSDAWSIQRQEDTSLSLGTVASPAILVSVLDLGTSSGAVDASELATGLTQQVDSLADAEVVAALSPTPNRIVIVFRDPDDGGELYRIYDIALDPTSTTAVTMIVGVKDVDAALTLVTTTLQVDGQPVMTDLRTLVPEIFAGA